MGEPDRSPDFPACGQCPTREACQAAEFCVIESRFGRSDLSIGELTCRTCKRGSESAWGCLEREDCDAQSALWGQWWLVRLYANDARAAATAVDRAADEFTEEDDYEACDHYCDEDCEDGCYHEHCFACGGCGCPGYCDDYQTYNLRPAETGGAEIAPGADHDQPR